MLHQLLRPALVIFSITLPLWFIFRMVKRTQLKKQGQVPSAKQEFVLFLFYVYVTCVFLITLVPIAMARSENPQLRRINLLPFVNTVKEVAVTFSPAKKFMTAHALENIVGNIILFIPLGSLLPLLFAKMCSAKKVLVFSFLFSFCIELMQLVSRQFGIYRSVDVDDIILNVSGALLGFMVTGRFFCKLKQNRTS